MKNFRNFPRRCRQLAIALGTVATGLAAVTDRPNIVLILADDIGYEILSSYGSADYSTPRLDDLAREGVRFTQAHSQPLCTPTRTQLMTGLYNVRNYAYFGRLDPTQRTFGHDLREAGYATAIAGKWQLGKDRSLIDKFGFDEYCLWWLERKSWRYGDVGELVQNGKTLPGGRGEYGPDVVNAFCLDFIERQSEAKKPFFLYYPMMLPHAPFAPTPDSVGEPEWDERDPKYFKDMVGYMDTLVGRVVDHLDALGLRESTLVVFLGDNGTNKDITSRMIDGREIRGGKGLMTDAGTRVPMIASWPSVGSAGFVSEGLVDFSDIMPTLHAVSGYNPADDRILDGVNLLPVLCGEQPTSREWSYCWYARGKDVEMVSLDMQVDAFARTTRFKLYRDGRFYDIASDALEERDLRSETLDTQARSIRNQLQDVIDRYDAVEAQR